jgi:2-amino-4-hydroxy-6-hydroxymethyldihydropteridine diphosphokinase
MRVSEKMNCPSDSDGGPEGFALQCAAAASHMAQMTYIALGSNMNGVWGAPEKSIAEAVVRLGSIGFRVTQVSNLYRTRPVGGPRQPLFTNAVVGGRACVAPGALLRGLKRLEREAGRRRGAHWGPRALDLDIVATSAIIGYPRKSGLRRRDGHLQCPHPEMHKRAFVLVPLSDVAPHWHHQRFGSGLRAWLERQTIKRDRRGVKFLALSSGVRLVF